MIKNLKKSNNQIKKTKKKRLKNKNQKIKKK